MSTGPVRSPHTPHDGRPSGAAVVVCAKASAIVLLGPPGSGKSTQGAVLAKDLGRTWLSVGDLIRGCGRRLPRGPGGLASTEATVALVREALAARPRATDLVLDGFPRSAEQVPAAIELLGGPPVCVQLELDITTALARMRGRGRPGEDGARQAQRYTEHAWRERALVEALRAHGAPVLAVDAHGPPAQVARHIATALEALQPGPLERGLEPSQPRRGR